MNFIFLVDWSYSLLKLKPSPKLHCFCNFRLEQLNLLATIFESSYQGSLAVVRSKKFSINKFDLDEMIQLINRKAW